MLTRRAVTEGRPAAASGPRAVAHSAVIVALALLWLGAPKVAAGDEPSSPVKNGFVTTRDGIKIHYHEAGTGRTLLFVPGWTMTAEIWESQVDHFGRIARVVAMDPRGQGDSTKSGEGLYPAARARDIRAVVDELKLAPVVLVGWSMGVTEVAAFVDAFGTADLAALVLVDGLAGIAPDPKIVTSFMQFAAGFQKDRQAQTAAFVRGMYRTPRDEAYLKHITELSLKTPSATAVALMVGMASADYRSALEKIDKPTLLAIAPGGPWDAQYAEMASRIRGARVEKFEGAGHALFVDQASKFNGLVEELLKASKK